MKPATLILGASLLTTALVHAEAAEEPQADPDAWTKTPTRYLGKSETHFVEAMKARLAITGRRNGPFGLPQDPSDEPQTPLLTPRKITKKVVRPFSDIVNAIPVTTVNAQEQAFYVGNRRFGVNQQFPIQTSQDLIKVQVSKVAPSRIGFTNLKTGEYVEKRLDLLPDGILTGNHSITVPGMTPANQNHATPLPIDLPGVVPKP